MSRIVAALVALVVAGCDGPPPRPDAGRPDAGRPAAPALRAAAVTIDITPEPGAEIVGFGNRTSTSVRDPLEAAVLLLERDRARLGIVTLDLPGISDWHGSMIRSRVALALRAPLENVIVVASHTHSAPLIGGDPWSARTMDAIVDAAATLEGALTPVTLAYGQSEIDFDVNRRLVVDGEAEPRPNPDGPHDSRVRVLRLRDVEGALVATLVHAVCHPNILRGPNSTVITADFVGDARALRDDDAPWLFLQGAAGDVRPNVVDATGQDFTEGTSEDIARIGAELAAAVEGASERAVDGPLAAGADPLEVELLRGGTTSLALSAFRIGDLVLLTMPGEPMVDIGLDVEAAVVARRPGVVPIVLGYTNGYADYIVTEEARAVGGYEVRRTDLVPEATDAIEAALVELAASVAY